MKYLILILFILPFFSFSKPVARKVTTKKETFSDRYEKKYKKEMQECLEYNKAVCHFASYNMLGASFPKCQDGIMGDCFYSKRKQGVKK